MKKNFAIGSITVFCFLYFLYFYFANEEINAGSLGTLGDFIGGNINPLLTFTTTILLIETLSLQRKATQAAEENAAESKKTINEQGQLIKTQIFEGSYFNLINLCLEDYKNAKLDTPHGSHAGSKAYQYIEHEFADRKKNGEHGADIVEELDSQYGDIIYDSIKTFSAAFSFVNQCAPTGTHEHYISLATKLTPMPILYLICISKAHTDWPILKPFDDASFFHKKGICELINGYS